MFQQTLFVRGSVNTFVPNCFRSFWYLFLTTSCSFSWKKHKRRQFCSFVKQTCLKEKFEQMQFVWCWEKLTFEGTFSLVGSGFIFDWVERISPEMKRCCKLHKYRKTHEHCSIYWEPAQSLLPKSCTKSTLVGCNKIPEEWIPDLALHSKRVSFLKLLVLLSCAGFSLLWSQAVWLSENSGHGVTNLSMWDDLQLRITTDTDTQYKRLEKFTHRPRGTNPKQM